MSYRRVPSYTALTEILAGRDSFVKGISTSDLANIVEPPTPQIQGPGKNATISLGGNHPYEPTIVDFHFEAIERNNPPFIGRFPVEEIIQPGPKELMRELKEKEGMTVEEPDLRWVHLPFNSMQHAEGVVIRACEDRGLPREVAKKIILRPDRWIEKLHNKQGRDDYHAQYMQTHCSEIAFSDENLQNHTDLDKDKFGLPVFGHRGASMVLVMPFLHWGKRSVLDWRTEMLGKIQDAKMEDLEKLVADGEDQMSKFYTQMMVNQIRQQSDPPLHLRRTLDQYYYAYTKDTDERDKDQVVSKYGFEGDYSKTLDLSDSGPQGKGSSVLAEGSGNRQPDHTILMVDQLWLWILGDKTLVTSFDRRWVKDNDPRTNVVDNVLWKLGNDKDSIKEGEAKRIKGAYELANLIIDEASSFFFTYTDDSFHYAKFSELFQKAISLVSEKQTQLFSALTRLSGQRRIMDLSRDDQHKLFDLSEEFRLVKEIRDIRDELNIILHIYKEQVTILPALLKSHHHDTLYHAEYIKGNGEHMVENTSRFEKQLDTIIALMKEQNKQILSHTKGQNGEHGEALAKESRVVMDEEEMSMSKPGIECEPLPNIDWDPREWFKRTKDNMESHNAEIQDMLVEVQIVYQQLLDTINLKQNNASIFEAHATRREGEAIMLFTIISSIILPLSFFTSVFGMNVIEINDGSKVSLSKAIALTIPISIAFIATAMYFAFSSKARNFLGDLSTYKGPLHEQVRRWSAEAWAAFTDLWSKTFSGQQAHAVSGVDGESNLPKNHTTAVPPIGV